MLNARRATLALLAATALLLGFVTPAGQGTSAQASTTVPVTVTVLGPDGAPFTWTSPDEQLSVRLWGPRFGSSFSVPVATTGTAQVSVPPGNYQIQVTYRGERNILSGWGNGQESQAGSTVTTVGAEGGSITANLRTGGTITGTVTGDGFPLSALSFTVYRDLGFVAQGYQSWFDVESQQYTITRLQPGTYRILFSGSAESQPRLVREWARGARVALEPLDWSGVFPGSPPPSDDVVVTAGATVSMSPLNLEVMSAITGTVTWPGNQPDPLNRYLDAYLDGELVGSKLIGDDGLFSFTDVAPRGGTDWVFCVRAHYESNSHQWAESCWSPDGATTRANAQAVRAMPQGVVSGIDINVAEGTRMVFSVYTDYDGPSGQPPRLAAGSEALLYRLSDDGERYEIATPGLVRTLSTPTHISAPLMPGTYVVQIVDQASPGVGRTWLTPSGTSTIDLTEQNQFVVADGGTITLDVILRPYTRAFDRISGPDRFATAVAISRETISDAEAPASVVYIVNGLNYPDALSAGPIAAQQGGAMLMVRPTVIPESVRAELTRLAPERIVIVGGTGAVSAAVEVDLRQYVDGDALRVERVGGSDRFAVSRALIATSFEGQTGMPLFIATGRNFPDALAAGPAAAALGGAVLLVNGAATTIDLPTRELIDTLQPSEIIIVGGPSVVSNGIASSLVTRYGEGNVFQIFGADRYSGAANLNEAIFAESTIAFLATGTSFADALAGGVLAGQVEAPLFLTLPQCIPAVTNRAMTTTRSSFAVIFGGTGAVSSAVERGTVCGTRSAEAPTSIPAPGSRSERQSDAEIERLREALGLP